MAETPLRWKRIAAYFFAALFAALLIWWVSLPSRPVTITVEEKASAKQIADALYKADIISSRTLFRIAVRISGKSKGLKAGTYMIPPRTSVFGIIRMISSGRGTYERVTIPEGYTAAEIAAVLSAKGITDGAEFLKIAEVEKLEGYLFPDTYFFDRKLPARAVIDKMLAEFKKNFTQEMRSRADEMKMGEKKIVTLASMIEKEAVKPHERALIAGVFYNRMKKGWLLESCATVQYALGARKKALTFKDLKVESPYNTYKYYGLPPGPISSPGKGSLEAALYPAETVDMFFVAGSSGTHVFSRYFREHINNKNSIRQKKKSSR